LGIDSCTTPSQQLHNNPLYEGGLQCVEPTLYEGLLYNYYISIVNLTFSLKFCIEMTKDRISNRIAQESFTYFIGSENVPCGPRNGRAFFIRGFTRRPRVAHSMADLSSFDDSSSLTLPCFFVQALTVSRETNFKNN